MIVTKYLDNMVFYHIYPWGETLVYIAWTIRASYYYTIMSTPGQNFFVTEISFKIMSVVDWRVLTTKNTQQVDIDNARENSRQVTYDYEIGD